MPALPTKPDETPTYIYNPGKFDFTYQWNGEPRILASRKMVELPKWLADHAAKQLASFLASTDSEKIHFEERTKKWLKQIYIQL